MCSQASDIIRVRDTFDGIVFSCKANARERMSKETQLLSRIKR